MTAVDQVGTCSVKVDPLAEVIVALGVVGANGKEPFGARYPRALRSEAELLARTALGDAAQELGDQVAVLNVNRVMGALISRDAEGQVDQDAADLVKRIESVADVSVVPAPAADTPERIARMHASSHFARAPIVDDDQRVHLWPVRLLPPAPAGKLFARNTLPGQPLLMASPQLWRSCAFPVPRVIPSSDLSVGLPLYGSP